MRAQQGDVFLFQEPDGGNIESINGLITMTGGFETMAYLALFGGNEADAGGGAGQWWGNWIEELPERHLISRTQHLLRSIPSTSGNLRRLQAAAALDLDVFLSAGIASSVTVDVALIGPKRVTMDVAIIANGEESSFTFTANWKATDAD